MLEIKNSLGLKNVDKVFRNLGRENLSNNAIDHDGAVIAYNGATIIETGIFTGRSPKDKYFVSQDESEKYVAWGDVNQKVSKDDMGSEKQEPLEVALDYFIAIRKQRDKLKQES